MLMGSAATEKEVEEYKPRYSLDPRQFIAQPIIIYPVALLYEWYYCVPRRIAQAPCFTWPWRY